MPDISSLNILPSEPLDFTLYKSVGESRPFPGKGRYTLRATESFPAEAFAPNKAGTALTIQIDPTIVGPTGEGRTLKYTRISAKTFKRGTTVVSQLGDYLKACGKSNGVLSGDPQEQANAAESTAGCIFEANLDWRLYAKGAAKDGSDLVIDGMENFPPDGSGGHVPYLVSDTLLNPETGEPKRLWANLVIDSFIPAS